MHHIADEAEHIYLALGATDFRNYEKYNIMRSIMKNHIKIHI